MEYTKNYFQNQAPTILLLKLKLRSITKRCSCQPSKFQAMVFLMQHFRDDVAFTSGLQCALTMQRLPFYWSPHNKQCCWSTNLRYWPERSCTKMPWCTIPTMYINAKCHFWRCPSWFQLSNASASITLSSINDSMHALSYSKTNEPHHGIRNSYVRWNWIKTCQRLRGKICFN